MKRRVSLSVALAVAALVLVASGWGVLRFARNEADAPDAEKLAHQWERYAAAQATLADRVRSGGTMSRREWERLLKPTGPYRWTRGDEAELRKQQRERIAASRDAARVASVIDLDEVRRTGVVRRFAELLPKGGMLHVHPTGTLQQQTVERLLEMGNPEISKSRLNYPRGFRREELAFVEHYPEGARYRDLRAEDKLRFQALFSLPEAQSEFDRFAAVFPLVGLLRRFPEANAWEAICTDFFARAQAQRVRYVEFTMHVEPTLEALRELQATARLARERHGIVLRVNAAFDRNAPAGENVERFRRLTAFLDANATPLVVGIDLSGNEARRPALEAGQLLYSSAVANQTTAMRLRRTFHAGAGDPRNFRDAILLQAERVGHGTQAMSDTVALEFAARQRIAVEANLTSNIRLGYAPSFAAHPFLDLLRLGLQVSLSTDDEGILDTTMSNEFALAISHTDISYAEVRQLVLNSIATSFAAAEAKESMLTEVEKELREFEELWPTHAAAQSGTTGEGDARTWAARSN